MPSEACWGDSCSARAPLHAHRGSVRQPGYGDIPRDANHCSCLVLPRSVPGSYTSAAAPRAFCCLLELAHCWLPRLIISSEPHSALLAEQCFFLQQWLQLADVHKAEGPLNQGRNHSKAAHEPGFCCKRSARKFGY